MFESLKRVKAWIPIDGTYDLGEGPRVSPEIRSKATRYQIASVAETAWKFARR